ncbi:hypothetical protein M9Y10_011957 [Tritrichomonas musculus]|uniref:F5/8 type C domain-containing protein n=1 Tax=Tritrichomonas musculus TaxID=1915356 RepID=A0ABR2ICA4_9EUKA
MSNHPVDVKGVCEVLQSLKNNNENNKEFEIVSSKCTFWNTHQSFVLNNDESQFVTFDHKNRYLQINFKNKLIDIQGYKINSSLNSYRYMKNWVLLGSTDLYNWVILDEHSNDDSLQSNDRDIINFNVNSEGIRFKSIKLIQTGKNNKLDHILVIRYFDLLGKIYD